MTSLQSLICTARQCMIVGTATATQKRALGWYDLGISLGSADFLDGADFESCDPLAGCFDIPGDTCRDFMRSAYMCGYATGYSGATRY